jgi:hypothetical protein
VKSENDYGISEPGEESDPFDVGHQADRLEICDQTICLSVVYILCFADIPNR